MTYKFRIAVCKDGRLDAVRKQSTSDPKLDGAIDNAVESLKIAAPPQQIRDQLGGSCKKIPHEFTLRINGGKTEIR